MVATFHLHYVGDRIKYGNLEVGNTIQQLLSTARRRCSIEYIESFWFWVILVTYNIDIYICIYIYKVSYIHSFFVIFNCNVFLHCMLNILRYEKIFCEIDEWLLYSSIHQVTWYSGCSKWIHFPFYAVFFFFPENCVFFGLLVSCLSLSQSA